MPHKGQNREPSANSSKSSNPSTPPDDNSQKSDKVDNEDIIGSYFKPRRATELLNQSSRLESSVFTTWRDFANKTKPRSSEGVHSPTIMSTFSFPHSNWLNGRYSEPYPVRRGRTRGHMSCKVIGTLGVNFRLKTISASQLLCSSCAPVLRVYGGPPLASMGEGSICKFEELLQETRWEWTQVIDDLYDWKRCP
uniref:Uncharacterized protein n=1 Tax=Photinus pyralis TaxID=7054 RepID=A0A1Y1KNF5_PHOPY